VLPPLLLEPSAKGSRLISELRTEFDDRYNADFRGYPPLNAILDYRRALERYGVDCNESFRNGLAARVHGRNAISEQQQAWPDFLFHLAKEIERRLRLHWNDHRTPSIKQPHSATIQPGRLSDQTITVSPLPNPCCRSRAAKAPASRAIST
jgi:hypothetical protein